MGCVLSESLSDRMGLLPFWLWQGIAHGIVMFNHISQNYLIMNPIIHMLCAKGTPWVNSVDGSSWCVATPKCFQFTVMSFKSNRVANTTHQDETCNSLTQGCPETGSEGGTQCAMWSFPEASWTSEEMGRFAYPPTALQWRGPRSIELPGLTWDLGIKRFLVHPGFVHICLEHATACLERWRNP